MADSLATVRALICCSEEKILAKQGPQPGQFTVGGLDVKLFKNLRLRGEVRDFWTGVPQLNVNTGKSHQHNYLVGAGVVWHF